MSPDDLFGALGNVCCLGERRSCGVAPPATAAVEEPQDQEIREDRHRHHHHKHREKKGGRGRSSSPSAVPVVAPAKVEEGPGMLGAAGAGGALEPLQRSQSIYMDHDDTDQDNNGGCCSSGPPKRLEAHSLLNRKRWCTDLPILLIFIAFLGGMVFVAIWAMDNGDIDRVLYGTDWRGQSCGGDRQNQMWPNPVYYEMLGAVCFTSCPGVTTNGSVAIPTSIGALVCTCNNQLTVGFSYEGELNTTTTFLGGKCLSAEGIANGYYVSTPAETATHSLWQFSPLSLAWGVINLQGKVRVPFCNQLYKTTSVAHRCFPKVSTAEVVSIFCGGNSACDMGPYEDYITTGSEMVTEWMSDIWTCRYLLLAVFGVATVIGLIYLVLMQWCAGLVVCLMILVVNAALTAACLVCLWWAKDMNDKLDETPQDSNHGSETTNLYIALSLAIFFGILEAIVLCICVCMCSRIRVAVALIKLASEGLLEMPYLLPYPLVEVLVQIGFVIGWVVIAAYLWGCGDTEYHATYGYAEYTVSDELRGLGAYWLFGLLWVLQFFSSVGFTVLAFCFAVWFFTPTENGQRKSPSCVLGRVIGIVVCKFLGTIAFGSFIIALIQFLRIILEYIDQRTKQAQKAGGKGLQCFWRCMFCCCRCFLVCFEKCMKYLNKNIYITMILHNKWFCDGMCHAMLVLFSHLGYIMVTKPIAHAFLWVGKVGIAAVSAALGGLLAIMIYEDELSSVIPPIFIMLIIGFAVANVFMNVYEMAIDTMLMCYCEAHYSQDMTCVPESVQSWAKNSKSEHEP